MEIQKIFTNPYTGERCFSVRLGEKEFGLAQGIQKLSGKIKSSLEKKAANTYTTLQRVSMRSAGENVTHALGRVGSSAVKNPVTGITTTGIELGLPLIHPSLAVIPSAPLAAVTKKIDNKLQKKFPKLIEISDKVKNFPNTKAGQYVKNASDAAWTSVKGFM